MQQALARLEGIWVEPASAAGLAGLAHEIAGGTVRAEGQAHRGHLHRARLERPGDHHQGDDQAAGGTAPALEALEEAILA